MPTQLAESFRAELRAIRVELGTIPHELVDTPWRVGGWTRKQILGHLLDSATNNRQRFVRAAIEGHYEGPAYSQEPWVEAHGYANQTWTTLLNWWDVEHAILATVVDRTPECRLEAECIVSDNAAVTLRFLIQDYLQHQRWHLQQMLTGAKAT